MKIENRIQNNINIVDGSISCDNVDNRENETQKYQLK